MMHPAGLGSPKGTGEGEDQHAVKAAGLLRSDVKEHIGEERGHPVVCVQRVAGLERNGESKRPVSDDRPFVVFPVSVLGPS